MAFEGNPLYTLTKQAVGGFVRALAPSLAGDRISIDAVCPGVVDTPMTVEAFGGGDLRVRVSRSSSRLPSPPRRSTWPRPRARAGAGPCAQLKGPVDWRFLTWSDLARAR